MSQSSKKTAADRFQPLEAQRTSDRVADAIGKTIVDGMFKPGEALPPERTLAERFGVTRNTVREALRMLEQSRLISVRQGSGVHVLDYLKHAGVEFLTVLLGSGSATQDKMVQDLSETRAVVGEAIANHALGRVPRSALPSLSEAIEALAREAAQPRPDVPRLQDLDFEIQHRLVRAAGNQALILLHNSVRHVYKGIGHLFVPLMHDPPALVQRYRKILAALQAGDRKKARRAMSALFADGQKAMAGKTK